MGARALEKRGKKRILLFLIIILVIGERYTTHTIPESAIYSISPMIIMTRRGGEGGEDPPPLPPAPPPLTPVGGLFLSTRTMCVIFIWLLDFGLGWLFGTPSLALP